MSSQISEGKSSLESKISVKEEAMQVLIFCEDPFISTQLNSQISHGRGMQYIICDDVEDGLTLFLKQNISAIIIIRSADEFRRSRFYDLVWRQCQWNNIPIFISSSSKELLLNIKQYPVSDEFIEYPFQGKELESRIHHKIIQTQLNREWRLHHITKESGARESTFMDHFYSYQLAILERQKVPFTMVFIKIANFPEIMEEYGALVANQTFLKVTDFLLEQIRDSDNLFKINDTLTFGVLLSFSKEKEAISFLNRLYKNIPPISCEINNNDIEVHVYLAGSIVEIDNSKTVLKDVIKAGIEAFEDEEEAKAFSIATVSDFKKTEIERIKVSIIENDPIVQAVLLNIFQGEEMDLFELEVKVFQDGHQFLQSDWYFSSHTHLIITNDILPKKTGLEVVHYLRQLPNNNKYLVIMLSNKKAEGDMVHAYELGVDDYIIKPIYVKMLTIKIRRILKRWR